MVDSPQMVPHAQVNKQQKESSCIGGSLVAMAAGGVAGSVAPIIGNKTMVPLMKKYAEIPADKVEIVHKAADKALVESGLANKGVQIKYIPENIKTSSPFEMVVAKGDNCFFVCKNGGGVKMNTILIPEKKMATQVFHEMGHAMNFNLSSALSRFRLNNYGKFALIPGMIALYGAFSSKSRPKDGTNELSFAQKTNNFIRDNAGKLSFLATLPILVEEGLASLKGYKLASKYLSSSPDILKAIKKGNIAGFASYAIGLAGVALASTLAVSIKDKFKGDK